MAEREQDRNTSGQGHLLISLNWEYFLGHFVRGGRFCLEVQKKDFLKKDFKERFARGSKQPESFYFLAL